MRGRGEVTAEEGVGGGFASHMRSTIPATADRAVA